MQSQNTYLVLRMNFVSSTVLTLYFLTRTSIANDPCENLYELHDRPFYKILTCFRSTLSIIARTSVPSLSECFDYAKTKGGLAINFSPPEESAKKYKDNYYFANCEVLECPEVVNSTSLVNDSAFDYYSMYGDLNALDNTTCIRNVGVFRVFYDKVNYTNAIAKCQTVSGDLAHILTEARTVGISNLIKYELKMWYKLAYVGLDNRKIKSRFETPMGDLLDCYKFRAWSPGHPRNKNSHDICIVIDSDSMWKSVSCDMKLPFVCEIYPMPYYKKTTTEEYNECDEYDDKEDRLECEKEKKKSKKKPKNKKSGQQKENILDEEVNERCEL